MKDDSIIEELKTIKYLLYGVFLVLGMIFGQGIF